MPAGVTNKLKPRKFYRNERCSNQCTLGAGRLPGDMVNIVHGWFEEGLNNDAIMAKARMVGVIVSNGATGRHRSNHLVPIEDASPDPTDLKLQKTNHIEFLEQLVSRGATSVHLARVTPDLALKAIDMIYRLTAGSAMTDMLEAVTAAMGSEDDETEYMSAIEAAEAKMGGDEQVQAEVVGE